MEITHVPGLLLLFANFTVIFIPTYIFTTFDQLWLKSVHVSVEATGFIFAVATLLSFFASNHLDRWIKSGREIVWLHISSATILLAYILLVIFAQNMLMAIFAAIVVRVARSVRNPLYSLLANEYIATGSRATRLSLLSVLDSVFDVVIVLGLASTVSGFSRDHDRLCRVYASRDVDPH
jgi:Na+/melibiose symporter-like transporter